MKVSNKYTKFYTKYLLPDFYVDMNVFQDKEFTILAGYVLYLRSNDEQINEYVPNSHIADVFCEVIYGMIIELYFRGECKYAGLGFKEFAKRDFEPIKHLPEAKRRDIIHNSYQKLREKENEIRNNLKLINIRLNDICNLVNGVMSKRKYRLK